ncbi:hypothetical protein ESA_00325 [Cronobacter sakazakii ATCC BAA-894]|uniref:Uncharacterized protein n=1 Tax=Cronobacter sakazakii (strain ATCC BAA-894) TaxID=290339 RepID=A7MNB6_CROS8|nr:hypothetical protein ESA_00325 [Cronobacter sakazakii ATCC BAA-894]
MNIDNIQPRRDQPLAHLGPRRVNRNAVIGNQHIDALARRQAGGDAFNHRRNTAAQQRGHHDGEIRRRGHIAVPAGRAAHHAVGAGYHVDVKPDVDFQRAQDHHVELVAAGRFTGGARVNVGGDFDVLRVTGERRRRLAVKALGVEQDVYQPFFMQIHQAAGDTAEREARLHAAARHFLAEKPRTGGGRRAGAGLHREAVFEIAGVFNHVSGVAGNHQLARIAGDARRADADFRRVAHAFYRHHKIHAILRQTRRHVRVRHQRFGQQHHVAGKLRIHHRVAERAAAGFAVAAVGVAKFIAARHAEKRHVNLQLAILQQFDAPAVGSGSAPAPPSARERPPRRVCRACRRCKSA